MNQVVWNVTLVNIPPVAKVERSHVINAWLGISTPKGNPLIRVMHAPEVMCSQTMDLLGAMLAKLAHTRAVVVLVFVWNVKWVDIPTVVKDEALRVICALLVVFHQMAVSFVQTVLLENVPKAMETISNV